MDNLVNIIKVLNKIGQEGVQSSKRSLTASRKVRGRRVRRVATGDLAKSLNYKVVKRGNNFRIDFGSSVDYADYIHEGVNGTKLSVGSKYSFKKSTKMANRKAVLKWIRVKGIKGRDKKGRFISNEQLSFAIARSIAQKGIVGVPYFTLGVERAMKKNEKALEQAMLKDLDINIKL